MATVAGEYMVIVEKYDSYLMMDTVVFIPSNIQLIAEYAEAIAELEQEKNENGGFGAW